MPSNRHRGTYQLGHPAPFELSRSRIEAFVKCRACFWLDRVKGVKFPSIPGFLLNSATDTLLKKDFDQYREKQQPHPFMVRNGLDCLVPFQHPHFEYWTQSLHFGSADRFHIVHEPTNIMIGGGLDDVWHNPDTNELHVVDYKSTASGRGKEVSLEGHYKKGYKRQMDIYQWILRRKGFDVSDMGYFVYVDADQHGQPGMLDAAGKDAFMQFKTTLLEYRGNGNWVEPILFEIKDLLEQSECPAHAADGYGPRGDKPCEFGAFLEQASPFNGTTSASP